MGNGREAILVDAGISCRETEKRMQRLGLSMNKIKAIFISHEHSDHIRGVSLSREATITCVPAELFVKSSCTNCGQLLFLDK